MSAEVVPLPRKAPSLAPILNLTATAMNAVNATILDRMQSEIPLIPALAGHLIAGGGKRMRPMLTLAGADLVGYNGARHHKLAAAVEFIHTATLLHDDVVDGSEQRRGKSAANIIFGNPATVLVGDFLFSRAFELMVEDGSLKVLKILSSASAIIAQGEVDQLTAQRKIETSEERYLHIIGAKTAALFAAASRIAAVVAECGEAEEQALDDYGRNLGIAFQLVDLALGDHRARMAEDLEHLEAAVLDHQLERAGEQEIADQNGRGVSEDDVRCALAAALLGTVDDVVMQQRGGVDELDRRGELVVARAVVADELGARERQHRPHALSAARDQVPGQRGNQRNLALHPVEDDRVDRVHRRGGEIKDRRERRLLAGQRDDFGAHARALMVARPAWQARNCC